jgi:hypothetical protein
MFQQLLTFFYIKNSNWPQGMKFLALTEPVVSCYQKLISRSGLFVKWQLKIVIHIFSCHLNLLFCYAFKFSFPFFILFLSIDNNLLKWPIDFISWTKGIPTEKTDNNFVQMVWDSGQVEQWANEPCNQKSVIVWQKTPTVTISFLYKKLLETCQKLTDNQKMQTIVWIKVKNSKKWETIHYLFSYS